MQAVVIRKSCPEDIPYIAKLESLCFSVHMSEEMLTNALSDENHLFISAIAADGTLAGYAGLMFVLDEGDIINIAVQPEFRRKGIAALMMKEMNSQCHKLGLNVINLEVRESNIPAKQLYTGLGFEVSGLRKGYYIRPKEDAIIMKLLLK